MKRFKIAVFGAQSSGKSAWIKRLCTGDFEHGNTKSTQLIVTPVQVATSQGHIIFELWDLPSDLSYEDTVGCFDRSAGALLFLTGVAEQDRVWFNRFRRICGEIPLILCMSKSDMKGVMNRKHSAYMNNLAPGEPKYFVSAKSNLNLEKPILELARSSLNDTKLFFSGIISNPSTPRAKM
jgi:GTP-binding nuclear protein Ran